MNSPKTVGRVQKVFDAVFLEPVTVAPELSAEDVDEWDSMLHISLVVAIESEFGISFRVGEVEATRNVGEFMDLIETRMREAGLGVTGG
jgi:acyl carrier protein